MLVCVLCGVQHFGKANRPAEGMGVRRSKEIALGACQNERGKVEQVAKA